MFYSQTLTGQIIEAQYLILTALTYKVHALRLHQQAVAEAELANDLMAPAFRRPCN